MKLKLAAAALAALFATPAHAEPKAGEVAWRVRELALFCGRGLRSGRIPRRGISQPQSTERV